MALLRYTVVLLFCATTTVLLRLAALESLEDPLSTVLARLSAADARFDTLGVAAQIFVLSLPRRTDRREQMDRLRRDLGIRWTYVDATEASDERVNSILDHVRWQRIQGVESDFRWPDDIESLVASDGPLQHAGSDLWATNSRPIRWQPSDSVSTPLLCATSNDTLAPFIAGLPVYRILSPAKVACWYSHWSIIHRIANDNSKPDVTMILEDDIDMERDIRERLHSVWQILPAGWDIVFLGPEMFPLPYLSNSVRRSLLVKRDPITAHR